VIGKELADVRAKIGPALEAQQKAFETPGVIKSGSFSAAADEVLKLKDRAANLQQALKNLADVSERNAVVQERLQRLQQESEGRLGFAERFATADPSERLRLNRGLVLANQAFNRGSLDGLGTEDTRLVIDTFKSLRGVTLSGFNGGPRAEDALKSVLEGSF